MQMLQYFSMLAKWYRLIIAAGVIAAAAVLAVSYLSRPTYAAEADVAIVTTGAKVNFDTQIQTLSDLQYAVDQTARRKSLTTIAESPDVATAVIDKLGNRFNARDKVPAELLRSIDAVNDGDLIKITAKANDPELAALIANTWAEQYQARVNAIYGDNPLSPEAIQSEADAARIDYITKEAALVGYMRDTPIDDLTREIAQKQQTLADLVAAENKLDRLLADAKSLRDHLAAQKSGGGPGDELAQVLLEAAAFSTTSNLPSKLGSTTQLSIIPPKSTDPNSGQPSNVQLNTSQGGIQPDILPANLQLRIDQLAGSSPADQLSSLDSFIAALQARRDAIQPSAMVQLQLEIDRLESQWEQENANKQQLVRARDLALSTYTTLTNKVAELNIAEGTKGSVVRLAVPAIAPDQPLASGRLVDTLLAGLVGLLLGAGAAFLLEYMNDSLRTSAELEMLVGMQALGAIPELPRTGTNGKLDHRADGNLAVLEPHSAASEAFRLLRYNLFAGPAPHVIVIASATPAEGKSTVAANLAASIAQAGKRVTMVDADLRRPSQHELFHLTNAVGLSDLLSQPVDHWQELAQATEVEGLKVITSGPVPADPTRLLEGGRFGDLLEKLKTISDVVLVDTPAVLGLADAALAARAADSILLVVRSNAVSRGDVLKAKQVISSTGVRLAGAVLNRARDLVGAATYKYYAGAMPSPQASSGEDKGIGQRLVHLVVPRR